MELHYPNKKPNDYILSSTSPAVLREKGIIGNCLGKGWINKLILGDNLSVLKTFWQDAQIKGKVRLVYIDPPFSTGRIFNKEDDLTKQNQKLYEDTLRGPNYLEFLRERLIFLKEILANDGSIYVHLDQKMAPHVKILMDEIFGSRNFRNWISRKKCHPKGYTRNNYGNIQDFILFYSKTNRLTWNKPLKLLTQEKIESSEYKYIEQETERIYKKVPLHAPGVRHGETGIPWKGRMPPAGKHWQYPPRILDEFDKQGKIYWSPTGNPRLKIYLDEREGLLLQDIWLDFPDPINQFTSVTDYPTEKNQKMLEKIIEASSNEEDIVMDCFVGSGTTIVAAEKLKRKWIAIDNSEIAINTCVERLQDFSKRKQIEIIPFMVYEVPRL